MLELVAAGESCSEAARRVGVNRRSAMRWANLAGMELQPGRIGGIPGVSAFRRSPRSRQPRVLPEGDYLDENGRLNRPGFSGRFGLCLYPVGLRRFLAA
ncbi:helix-turn-helix domain-containing protein [Microlunatus parietis]|uniref:helix-turn-helix domain-containing protein n=1 Tax=Microlunatus parietis TaxID=682979 RepID=UPI0035E44A78